MADFDLSTLINNPTFQSGLGLLGAANPNRNASLLQAYQILNAQTQAAIKNKQQEALQKLEAERTRLYGEQVTAASRKNAQQEALLKMFQPVIESIADKYRQAQVPTAPANPVGGAIPAPVQPQTQVPSFSLPMPGQQQPPPGAGIPAIPSQPAPVEGQAQVPSLFGGSQEMMQLGAIANMLGGNYGEGFKGLAEANMPKEIKPDTTYQLPGGQSITTPASPMQSEELKLKKQSAAREAAAETRHQTESTQKLAVAKATDFGEVKTVLDSAMEMATKASQIKLNPALERITGVMGIFPNIPGQPAADVQTDLENLKAKNLLTTITALKSLSKNGSTGFGQLSNIEGEKLENSIASLKTTQGASKMRQNLDTIMQSLNRLTDRTLDVYERTHKESPYEGLPVGTRPAREADGSQSISRNGFPLLKLPNGEFREIRQ